MIHKCKCTTWNVVVLHEGFACNYMKLDKLKWGLKTMHSEYVCNPTEFVGRKLYRH